MREVKISRDELANAFQDYGLFKKTIEVEIMQPSYLQIIENAIDELLEIVDDYETRQKLIKILKEVKEIVWSKKLKELKNDERY